jgi:hypothetical protein
VGTALLKTLLSFMETTHGDSIRTRDGEDEEDEVQVRL